MLSHRPDEIWDNDRARWMEGADARGLIPGPAVYGRYVEKLGIAREHAVLDLGVGTGRVLPHLVRRARFACGIDISMPWLARARGKPAEGASLVNADAQALPFADGSFDRIFAWAMWENIPNQRRALREAARVLRPGGRLLFSGKNLMNRDALRLVRWRVKGSIIRALWRRARLRPGIVRATPARLRQKLEAVLERVDIPQYPTFWPLFLPAARRVNLKLVWVDKFHGPSLDDSVKAPERAWRHQQFVVMFEKGRDVRG